MALFGAGWAVTFDVGVRVYIAEVVAVACLVGLPWRDALHRYLMVRAVLSAFALWALAIAIADLVNGTALFDFLRNFATPILGGLSLLFVLTVLSRNPYALLTFFAATVVAKGALGEPLYGDEFADMTLSMASVAQDSNFFKVRIEPFLTPAILLFACMKSRKGLDTAAAIFLAAAIGYFLLDARSSGLVFFLSASAVFAIHHRIRPKLGSIVIASIGAAIIAYVGYIAYAKYSLTQNPYGHNAKQMARMENPYNPLELLIQGRSEWLVIGTAIAERPVIGWGSWAVDKDNRFTILRNERSGLDYGSIDRSKPLPYIPAHSVIGSAWLWSGLLGAIALVWLLRSLGVMGLRLVTVNSILVPAAVFLAFLAMWHLLFSPPQMVRLFFPVSLGALIAITGSVRIGSHRNIRLTRREYLEIKGVDLK